MGAFGLAAKLGVPVVSAASLDEVPTYWRLAANAMMLAEELVQAKRDAESRHGRKR